MEGLMVKLLPDIYEEVNSFFNSKKNYIHYTSCHVAESILRNENIWMRNTNVMNDNSEGKYSIDLFYRSISDNTSLFDTVLDKFDLKQYSIRKVIESITQIISEDTYITCFSEYNETDEHYGRLSMWRSYGEKEGAVGIVLNKESVHFSANSEKESVLSLLPVFYSDYSEFNNRFQSILSNTLNINPESYSHEEIYNSIILSFIYLIFSTKHPSFKEEREWRLIHNHGFFNVNYVEEDFEIISGVLQPIFKINVKKLPNKATFNDLIKHIIVGPSNHPKVIESGVKLLLKKYSIKEWESKVLVSNIPLRI